MKVAGYATGKPGTDKYEHFAFWAKDNKRTEVIYAYGKNHKEVKLEYVGKDQLNHTPCFKLRFANNYVLYVRAKNFRLQVTDSSGNYNKTFSWEYERPVNGVGTFCDVCAADEKEAMGLIRPFYLE